MDKQLVDGFLDCVREAGRVVREQWNDPREIAFKGRIDLVTQTDLAVERLLSERLPALLPGSSVLAEESHTTLVPGDLTWIVDPVDGTTNYAHRIPMVAVSVALWRGGRVELGAVFLPVMDELFWAVRGEGAFLNGERIRVSGEAVMQSALIATGFPYSFYAEIDEVCARLRRVLLASQGIRRMGSAAVDLGLIPEGKESAKAGAYVNVGEADVASTNVNSSLVFNARKPGDWATAVHVVFQNTGTESVVYDKSTQQLTITYEAGVTIGTGSVIGAKSLVKKDIPPRSIAFGVPAAVYQTRGAAGG